VPTLLKPAVDPVRAERERRRLQRRNALEALMALERAPGMLKRPVFFVPGWRDEGNVCWKQPYAHGDTAMAEWLPRSVKNTGHVTYITFTEQESVRCSSFFDFGNLLRHKIWDTIGKRRAFDIVGHSMGGLDAIAAITHPHEPMRHAHHLITVGTPHQGSELGEIGTKLVRMPKHHQLQGINLDPDQLPIQLLNRPKVRQCLLENITHLHCLLGTRDLAVMRSGRFNPEEIPQSLYEHKVSTTIIEGARHSQALGITQDVRTILKIMQVLLDLPIEAPQRNYGYIHYR
jgi:pimeloyl-ACP methyl ester carboxylesterase